MERADAELLALAREGNRPAGDAFVARHLPRVWRHARALAGDPVAADDLVQETFLAALRAGSAPAGDDAGPWLSGILRHAWHRSHRRRVGEPAAVEPLLDLGLGAGWGSDPERAAVAAEDRARLDAALAALDPESREVLWARDVEGLDGAETAALLGLGVPAMKSRLHRARLELMRALREGGSHGP